MSSSAADYFKYQSARQKAEAAGQTSDQAHIEGLKAAGYATPSTTTSSSTSSTRSQGNSSGSSLPNLQLITYLNNQDAVSKAGEIVNQDQSKASQLQSQLKQLQNERAAKTQVWENGIYMGENKELAQQYDAQIADIQQQLKAEQERQVEADPVARAEAEKKALNQQLNDLWLQRGEVSSPWGVGDDKERLAQYDAQIADVQQQIKATEEAEKAAQQKAAEERRANAEPIPEDNLPVWAKTMASSTTYFPGITKEVGENIAPAVVGGAQESASGFINAAADFLKFYGKSQSMSMTPEEALAARSQGKDLAAALAEKQAAYDPNAFSGMYETADELAAKAAENREKSTEAIGRFPTDIVFTGTQMLVDTGANLVLPGSGLVSMGLRSYGSGSRDARQQGMTEEQQFLSGAKTAGIEILTEKLFGVFGKTYGGGVADDMAEAVIGKLASTDKGRTVLRIITNMAEEGSEEALSDVLNPLADRLLGLDDGQGSIFKNTSLEDVAYDYLVGSVMGAFGAGTNVLTGQDAANNAALRARDGKSQADSSQTVSTAPQTAQEAAGDIQTPATPQNASTQPKAKLNTANQQTGADYLANYGKPVTEQPNVADLQSRKDEFNRRAELYQAEYEKLQQGAEITQEQFDALKAESDWLSQEYTSILAEERRANSQTSVNVDQPENHIDRRSFGDVADKGIKSFQFDHPQLHEYYVNAAQQLMDEVQSAEAQSALYRYRKGGANYYGPVGRLLEFGMTKPRIMQCLEDIIRNNGAENYADAKRVEIVLNDMMTNGWETMGRRFMPADTDYVAAKEAINGAIGVNSWEKYLADREYLIELGEATEEQLRAEWESLHPEEAARQNGMSQAEPNVETDIAQQIPGQQTSTAQRAGSELLNYGKDRQNNAASSTETESTAINDNPTVHTAEENANIEKYKASVDESIKEVFEEYYKDPNKGFSRHNISTVTDKQSSDIASIIGGDYSGYRNAINSNGIKHILNEHGPNGTVNHSMGDLNDIARIGYILDNYDSVEQATYSSGEPRFSDEFRDSKNRPAPMVVFSKKVDGTYYVIEAVPDTKYKKLWVVSAYMDKKGGITQAPNAQGPGNTSNTSLASLPQGDLLPTTSIPNTPQNVNTETDPNMRERGFSQNIRTDENMEAEIRRQFEDSPLMYQQLSNADTLAKAQDIYDKGLPEATAEMNKWIGEAKAGRKMPPEAIPLSRMIANELTRQGRVQEAVRIESDIAAELTLAGQYAQAARILRDSSNPAAKAMFIENLVSSLNSDLTAGQQLKNRRRGMGDETGRIVVDDALLNEYANATTDEASNAAIDKINQSIAQQMPATFSEKFTAMRYVNMLGNLKTQGRNVGGNVLMLAATMAKRRTQAAIESLASAATGGKVERTTSFGINKKLYKAGIEDANAIMDTLQGDAKYSDSRRVAIKGIQDRRQIFNSKILEGYRKATNWALEAGDRVFLRANYADAFQGYLSAHGIKDISEASPEVLNAARTFAIREAQEATFRDSNKIADWVSSLGRGKNTPKAVQILGEGVMPFRKTPANVGIRAVEYSPLGVAETIYKAVQTKKGDDTATDVINSASKNIVGTSLAVAGYLLAASGNARGTEDDDELAYFQNMRGAQDYSVKVGDEYISLSQLAPTAVPFFMGVELYNALEDGGASLDTLMKIPGAVTGPLLEMSMLSGINDTLADLTTYGGDGSALPKLFANTTISYMTQFLTNSLAGQAEQASEEYRQTTYSQPGNKLGSFQYVLGQIAAKTPGVDYNQQDYIDAWGRRQSNGPLYERLFNAFLNPVYTSSDRSTEVDAELERLYTENKDLEGFPNVLPDKASRSTEYTKGVVMTPEEYQQYSIDRGQMSLELISEFMSGSQYKDMDDQARAEVISNLYSLAADRALKKVKTSNGVEYTGNYDDIAKLTDIPAYMASKAILSQGYDDRDNFEGVDNVIEGFYDLPEDVQAQLKDDGKGLKNLLYADKLGIGSEQYYNLYDTIKEMNEKTADSSDVATAVTIASAVQGTDEDKLNALKAMILPAKGTGKTASTVRRFEAALSYGQQYGINITYDDWAEFEAKVKEVDENGSVSKADLFAAWADSSLRNKIDKNTARKIYNTYKDDEDYVDMYDEDYAAEYPVEEKEPEIGTYDWLMNQLGANTSQQAAEPDPLKSRSQSSLLFNNYAAYRPIDNDLSNYLSSIK